MRKSWMYMLALAGILSVAMPLYAHEGGKTEGDKSGSKSSYKVYFGKVSAVNAQDATITFTNKEGESHSFTIPATTAIEVNGKAGTMAEITLEMYGAVKVDENGTPVKLRASLPKAKDKPAG